MDLKAMKNKLLNKSTLSYSVLFIVLTVSLLKDLQLLGIITLIFLIFLIEPNKFEYLFTKVLKKINIGSLGFETHTELSKVTAEQAIDEKTDSDNKDFYVLYLEGDKLLSNREYEAAVNKYEEAIRLNNQYTNAYINLGVAYHNLWMITKNQKYLKKSADASKKALELNPKGYRPKINLAVIYSKADETKNEALKLLEEADEIGKSADPLLRGKVKLFKSQIIVDKLHTSESEKYEARIPEIQKDLNESIFLFQKASWTDPEALYWIKQPSSLLDYIKSEAWK